MVTRRHVGVGACLLLAVGIASTAFVLSRHHRVAALPDIDRLRCDGDVASAAEATNASKSFPSAPALATLAKKEATPIRGRIVSSGHGAAGAQPPLEIPASERATLARQMKTATAAACGLLTPEAAAGAGYSLSSAYTQGVGTHWINWDYVDAPFDPAHPSMLLFGKRLGRDRLVGFSYWTRDPSPEGFAGNADHWHRHFGLCFDATGILQREGIPNSSQCSGTWLNGSDLWMLHAWIVPGQANAWGVFAPLDPVLCDRRAPDIVRCPGVG